MDSKFGEAHTSCVHGCISSPCIFEGLSILHPHHDINLALQTYCFFCCMYIVFTLCCL